MSSGNLHTSFLGLFFLAILFTLSGCEMQGQAPDTTVSASAIPWNKPASWEGPGALGAMGFQGTH